MSALVVPQLRETGCCAQLQQLASLLLSDAFRDPIVLLGSMFIAAQIKNSMITPQSIKLGLIPALFSGFDSSKGRFFFSPYRNRPNGDPRGCFIVPFVLE